MKNYLEWCPTPQYTHGGCHPRCSECPEVGEIPPGSRAVRSTTFGDAGAKALAPPTPHPGAYEANMTSEAVLTEIP